MQPRNLKLDFSLPSTSEKLCRVVERLRTMKTAVGEKGEFRVKGWDRRSSRGMFSPENFGGFDSLLQAVYSMAGLRSLAPLLRVSTPVMRNPAIAYRFLSSSSTSHATPTPLPNANQPVSLGAHTTQHHPALPTNVLVGGNKTAHWNEATFPNLPPTNYNQGPSALDKASRLFFFTEILRGTHAIHSLAAIHFLPATIGSIRRIRQFGFYIDGITRRTSADHSYAAYRNGRGPGAILPTPLHDYVPLW